MIQILQEAGLTKNEAKVYIAFLELGESSILEVSKKTRLHRSVVHVVSEKLVREDLLIENLTGTKRKLSARSPDHLRETLRRDQRELRKKELKFEEYLPELRRMHRKESKEYVVNILDGEKGLHTWCDLVLEESFTEMLEFVRIEELTKKIDPYLQNVYFPNKNEVGLPTRFLFADTPAAHEYVEKNYLSAPESAPMTCKFVLDNPKMMHGYMVIWNDNLSFYSSPEMKVTILRDKNIADHERAFFDVVWGNAGESFTNRPNQRWEEIIREFEKRRANISTR